jgi:hypothetical protein
MRRKGARREAVAGTPGSHCQEGSRRALEMMMAKKSQAPTFPLPAVPPSTVPPDYNAEGAAEQRDVVASKDGWSEFTLDDGSTIRLKAQLLDAKRAVGQYSPDGNPLYLLQFAVVNQLLAPNNLRKKSK